MCAQSSVHELLQQVDEYNKQVHGLEKKDYRS